jgi:hypothetical protein
MTIQVLTFFYPHMCASAYVYVQACFYNYIWMSLFDSNYNCSDMMILVYMYNCIRSSLHNFYLEFFFCLKLWPQTNLVEWEITWKNNDTTHHVFRGFLTPFLLNQCLQCMNMNARSFFLPNTFFAWNGVCMHVQQPMSHHCLMQVDPCTCFIFFKHI